MIIANDVAALGQPERDARECTSFVNVLQMAYATTDKLPEIEFRRC